MNIDCYYFQTFEAKIHHLETRPCRKLKDNMEGLEYFVRCELHLSDVSTLIGSLKRNAEDVKTTKEVKCKSAPRCGAHLCTSVSRRGAERALTCPSALSLVHWFPKKIADLDKCHHLVTKFDPDLDQDHPVSNVFYLFLSGMVFLVFYGAPPACTMTENVIRV